MPKTNTTRFARIARDLEKLPSELIEPVIADLELQTIIRIAQHGGPRLIWSVENSPKYRCFFQTRRLELQYLLTVTDQLATFLHQNPAARISNPDLIALVNPYHNTSLAIAFTDANALITSWLSALQNHVHRIAASQGRLELRRVATYIVDPASRTTLTTSLTSHHPLTPSRISTFLTLYQTARHSRATALAAQLRRLATLYSKNPTRLKQPFAPQTSRPNAAHVPTQLRIDADRIENRDQAWEGRDRAFHRFRHAFPALVPYNWCLRLFARVVEAGDSPWPVELAPAVKRAVEGMPCFYERFAEGAVMRGGDKVEDLRVVGTKWAVEEMPEGRVWSELEKRLRVPQRNGKGEGFWAVPGFLTMEGGSEEGNEGYFPHPEAELEWLEAFVTCVEWMEERFPKLVEEVRGVEWEEGGKLDVRRAVEKRKKRKEEKKARVIKRAKKAKWDRLTMRSLTPWLL